MFGNKKKDLSSITQLQIDDLRSNFDQPILKMVNIYVKR